MANNKFKSENNISHPSPKIPKVNDKKRQIKKQKLGFIQSNSPENGESNKSDGNIVLNHYDTDKLDELILDAKKKKLNSPKNLDMEEALFTENKEKNNQEQHQRPNVERNKKRKNIETAKNIVCNGKVSKLKKKNIKHIESPKIALENNINNYIEMNKNTILNGKVNTSKKKKDKLKMKLSESIKKSEPEEEKNSAQNTVNQTKSKDVRKKEIIKSLLQQQNHRNSINISKTSTLRDRMLERLKGILFSLFSLFIISLCCIPYKAG